MVCIAPNGYIIDVLEPFKATEMQGSCEQLWRRCLRCVIYFTRGICCWQRDIREYLKRKGFMVKMPDIIPPGKSQLSLVIIRD